MEIEIRPLTGHDTIAQIETLQKETWGIGELEVLPTHFLHALQHNGALLLGAFDDDRLVGFTFATLGMIDKGNRIDEVAAARLKLYSVVTGVHPDYQGQRVGHRLKLAQREFALRIGVRLITWTYDPLESRNGYFNISKLGAICNRYLLNYHGNLGGINAGLPTDRFEVEWWVTSNRVQSRVSQQRRSLSLDALLGGGALLVNEATFNSEGQPVPPLNYISRPSNLLLMEIPTNFQQIKQADPELARYWRDHSRTLFQELFHSDFIVTDFASYRDENGRRRSFYLLTYRDS
jgi:predicted GNAT superfamily acetyltransferase